ncbi:MAG: putative hydrolase of HD superfamily, partial [Myxococcota bacterium]
RQGNRIMMDTDRKRVADCLSRALELKRVDRAGWLRIGIDAPESVAGHSWGVGFLAMTLCPPGLDRLTVVEMALIHDLPEVIAGDITPHDGVSKAQKHQLEHAAMVRLTESLPRGEHVRTLFEAYEAGETEEARFVKACDKLDMALQAGIYAADGFDTREFVQSACDRLGDSELASLVCAENDG